MSLIEIIDIKQIFSSIIKASVVLSLFWRLFAMRQTVKETVGRYPVHLYLTQH